MKFLIKWLCFLYFSIHSENTVGLLFYDENFGGLRIRFDPIESEVDE